MLYKRNQNILGRCIHIQTYEDYICNPHCKAILSRKKEKYPVFCSICNRYSFRIIVCMTCQMEMCFSHFVEHSVKTKHYIGYSFSRNKFVCGACRDYILNDNKLQIKKGISNNRRELSNLAGLRGIINLGSTCFLSSVLQALVHNPILRNYFLGLSVVSSNDPVLFELTKLFQEIYREEKQPLNPAKFINVMWKSAGHLAGYHQQDAHEFLMAVFNGISGSKIGDFVFKGKLQSVISCRDCGDSSVRIEPVCDLSLHLKTTLDASTPPTPTFSHRKLIMTKREDKKRVLGSIDECLQKYTSVEILSETKPCKKCSRKNIVKRLTLSKLPMVIALHLKRFEQIFGIKRQKNIKIDEMVSFPMELDMFPYCSSKIQLRNIAQKELYSLFAVITHSGNINSGHYTCYVKNNGRWFLCDDSNIFEASEAEVLRAQAYILFYVQKELKYKH